MDLIRIHLEELNETIKTRSETIKETNSMLEDVEQKSNRLKQTLEILSFEYETHDSLLTLSGTAHYRQLLRTSIEQRRLREMNLIALSKAGCDVT
jgi:hypothetical protein